MQIHMVRINPPFIKLDAFLKFCGACGTGGEAKQRIQNGEVLVDGQVCTQRGRKLEPGSKVHFLGNNTVYYEISAMKE